MFANKMKNILLICVVLFVNNMNATNFSPRLHILRHNPPPPPEDYRRFGVITQDQFTQKLDHFDPTNTMTWSQRYYTNNGFYDPSKRNIVFLMIGGESAASSAWMNYGPWVASARKYHALLFQLEHRFYGSSQPFSDLSLENLRYLSSQQALADLAYFIVSMNEKYQLSSDVKWILFGGSYSGSLAAWMRVKYPHLVHGVMSASGPLLAKLDFYEYMQVVADDLADTSAECVNNVKEAVNQVESLLNNPSSISVTRIFNLCDSIEDDLDNTWDVANFFESITIPFAAIAQYNNIPGTKTNLDDLCNIMNDKTIGTEIYRLAEVNRLYSGTRCLNYSYDYVVQYLKDPSKITSGERQWIYQTCTEYGWYQTTNQEDQVFGNRYPVDFFTRLCRDTFGEKFNEAFISQQIGRTNMDYGALDINASNIVYVHGTYDPWHVIGLTETTNPESPVILINGTAHCANFYEQSANDLPQLNAARAEVDRLIGVWLGLISDVNS